VLLVIRLPLWLGGILYARIPRKQQNYKKQKTAKPDEMATATNPKGETPADRPVAAVEVIAKNLGLPFIDSTSDSY
jgi:hypothetical protein